MNDSAAVMSRRPDFLFIGPDKAGSSWLYEVLRQHPGCFVPPAKDIYFFDRYYQRGWPWYAGHFRSATDDRMIGELSHDYLFSPQAAARIASDLPGVKLLTILREPVGRSFSHYLYMIRSGRTRLSFEEAIEKFPELVNNSLYAKHLQFYFDLFDRDQVGIFFFDDLQRSPPQLGRDILGFLGLPALDAIEYDRHVRPASAPRNFWLAKLAKQAANATRGIGLPNLVGAVKNSSLAQQLYRPYTAVDKPGMSESTRLRLQQLFAKDLAKLADLLGGYGPAWLAPGQTGNQSARAGETNVQGGQSTREQQT